MLAVIEHELVPPPRLRERLRKTEPFRLERFSSPVCVRLTVLIPINAPERERERRCRVALGRLASVNAATAVVGPDFPCPSLPGELGFLPADPGALYRKMAGRICEWAADEMAISPQRLHVWLVGARASPELLGCAVYLRDRAGKISISAGRDTGIACEGLRVRYGMACCNQLMPGASIILLFDRTQARVQSGEGSLAIDLTGGVPAVSDGLWANGVRLTAPKRVQALPFAVDTPSLLAGLAAYGSVRPGELAPEGLTAQGKFVDIRQISQKKLQ